MLSKIFKAYDIRHTYPDMVNEEAAWKIGVGVGQFLKDHPERPHGKHSDTVLVSRDMRKSSPSLCEALIKGIGITGMNVIELGMCDTSFCYFAVNHLGAAGAVQVTASHNPPNYNGFKISGPHAKPIGALTGLKDIQAIAERAGELGKPEPVGHLHKMDLWHEYRQHILRFYQPPKKGRNPLKVFIDGSNGMAGKLIPHAFGGVEGVEIVDLNFEITGEFVHDPNPLVAENMIPTQQGVRKHKADVGACFDGDADRCMITDEKGETVGCDHLTALLASHFLKVSNPDHEPHIADPIGGTKTIVYDLRSSKVVEETIRALGATPVKGRVGHVFMKATLRETQGVFGGELSGHFYFRDNFYADSGAITLASVLWVLGQSEKPLSELVAPFRKYPQSGECNYRTADTGVVLKQLKQKYAAHDIDELDGVTVDAWAEEGWWFNVRASNTEPLLRLNAEARDKAGLDKLLAELTPMLGEQVHGH